MNSNVSFEDHESVMENLPIIFHKKLSCDPIKAGHYGNWHENIEIIRITYGEGAVLCDQNRITVKKDDIVIINSNVIHTFFSNSILEYQCLIINRLFAQKNGVDTNKLVFTDYIPQNAEALKLMDNICNVMTDSVELIDISATVLPLLCFLYHNFSEKKDLSDEKSDSIIKDAVNYIRLNLHKNISIDEIAENIGVSKFHFIRKFKNTIGYTPVQYINMQRCELAKRYLRSNVHTVKQVAQMCGFESASYFSKVFFKYTGVLPSDFN